MKKLKNKLRSLVVVDHVLHIVGANGIFDRSCTLGKQYRKHQSSDQPYTGCVALCDSNVRLAIFLEDQDDGIVRHGESGDTAGRNGSQAVHLHLAMVCLRSGPKCDHPRVFLEKPRRSAVRLRVGRLSMSVIERNRWYFTNQC